jgi:hypothetical protein
MKTTTTMVALLLAVALAGCTSIPKTSEGQSDYYVDRASDALGKGDTQSMVNNVQTALDRITGEVKVNNFFEKQPKAREVYVAYLDQTITSIMYGKEASTAFRKISEAKGVLTVQQFNSLTSKLNDFVAKGNANGSLAITLSDDISSFSALNEPDARQRIVERTIKVLQVSGSPLRPIQGLMAYVKQVGTESDEGKRIETLLPTLNIRRDELDLVAPQFPQFASARKDAMTAKVFLKMKNGDRLFSDDLMAVVRRKIRGVEWVKNEDQKITTVVVERIRNDEKTIPERSQTITYAQYEVDIVAAALLMPRNASYIYEAVTGGAEIEYGYVITAMLDGRVTHEEVVRGKSGGESTRCQNARIQNVFGGTTSAGFSANDDMKRRCGSSSASNSIDALRQEVLEKVVDGVLKVPVIKVSHDVN